MIDWWLKIRAKLRKTIPDPVEWIVSIIIASDIGPRRIVIHFFLKNDFGIRNRIKCNCNTGSVRVKNSSIINVIIFCRYMQAVICVKLIVGLMEISPCSTCVGFHCRISQSLLSPVVTSPSHRIVIYIKHKFTHMNSGWKWIDNIFNCTIPVKKYSQWCVIVIESTCEKSVAGVMKSQVKISLEK